MRARLAMSLAIASVAALIHRWGAAFLFSLIALGAVAEWIEFRGK